MMTMINGFKIIYIVFLFLVSTSVYAGAPPPPDDEIPVTENIGMLVVSGGIYVYRKLLRKSK